MVNSSLTGERVSFNFATEVWDCVPEEENFICPGIFNTDCSPNFDIKCQCHNQVRANVSSLKAYFIVYTSRTYLLNESIVVVDLGLDG